MMKKLLPFFWCLIVVLSAAGCSKQVQELINQMQSGSSESAGDEENSIEEDAVRFDKDTSYVNGYLDFSYTVPKGWWLYSVNRNNFSEDPGDTADPEILDINFGTDLGRDYKYIDLISVANLQFSGRDSHLGFDISAEALDNVQTIEGYMDYYESYMLQPGEGVSYEMLESDRTEIKGFPYERRIFEVIRESRNYNVLTLTRGLKDGYYLTISVSYWPDNKNAGQNIISALTRAL
ncbi:MAG: hypothetical protein LBJ24_06140 [Treponema sp.]|jgi:hypothetical protein|nr:hypothetical protein [Treponema sp.]